MLCTSSSSLFCLFYFARTEAIALSERERAVFARFCAVLARDLVPYVNRCMEAVFPPETLGLVLGTQRPQGLDTKDLIRPLLPMIPQDEQVEESLAREPREKTKQPEAKDAKSGQSETAGQHLSLAKEKEQSVGAETSEDEPALNDSKLLDSEKAVGDNVSELNSRFISEKVADKTSIKAD